MSFRETMGEALGDGIRHRRVVVADGGRLPVSPRRFLEEPASGVTAAFLGNNERREDWSMLWDIERGLGSNDQDYYSTYIVDKNGNEYEPYALAWRYLGMYMDCDQEDCADDDGGDCDDDRRRRLRDDRHLGGSNDEGGNCERMLLWAAYVDHHYRGHSIGGYQFYDVETGEYDQSMCQTQSWKVWDRCKRLDCHDLSPTNFELIGVFKETDGLSDWAEQLFKHQAYCIWDEDTYESMQSRQERWPNQCVQLYYFYDSNGNSLYFDLQPLPEGNVTLGIYTDDKCSQVADVTWFDYVSNYYNRYGDSDKAEEAIERWNQTFQAWNDGMTPFKKCQPCRAYNLNSTSQGGSEYGEQRSHDRQERRLGEDNQNDGEGGEEQYGYDCYDDAGYTNCDQCYKFFAKTDLEPASADDLARASDTILSIRVDGVLYGSGGFYSPPTPASYALLITGAALGIAVGLILVAVHTRYRHRMRVMPQSLKEELVIGGTNSKGQKRKKKKREGREADTDDASAYTEYTTSCDDDDSRGSENFKASRLALSRSIDRVSDNLKVLVSKSIDKAACLLPDTSRSRHDRKEVAMTPTRASSVYLLPDSLSQRLDILVDYIMPMSSPEETGAESNDGSYAQYDDTTSFPGDEDDEETGYTSNSDEEQPKTSGTWIELPLRNKEEDVEVSSIEGLTTDVSSDGEEQRSQTQQNGLVGPQATQNSTASSFSSGSEVSSSSAYESPDEAVWYHLPGTGIEAPLVKQYTSIIVETDRINTRCSAISEGSEETDTIVIHTMKEEKDDEGDAVELSTSPTKETGDTARVQKSACDSCLTALALDFYPSNESKGSTNAGNEWAAEDNLQPSPTPSSSPSSGNRSNPDDELTKFPPIDESDNGKDETNSDLAGNETKAAVLAALLLDSIPSREQKGRTDASEKGTTGDRQTSSISSSPVNGNEFESVKKLGKDESDNANDETNSDGAGNESKEGLEQSRSKSDPTPCSLLALDIGTATSDRADNIVSLHSQTDKRGAVIHDDDHVIENEAERTHQNDCAIRAAETPESQSTDDIDGRHGDIAVDEFVNNDRSSPDCYPLVFDPSGIYNIDSVSLLDDPSGTYTGANPIFLTNQPALSNAAIWTNSILAVTGEEEERDGDSGSYHAMNDRSTDDDSNDVMTVNPTDNPEGSFAVDTVAGHPNDQSCSTSCWALLALDEDDPPVETLPPAPTATAKISNVVESSSDHIVDNRTEADAYDAHDVISNGENSLSSAPPTPHQQLVPSHDEISSSSDNGSGDESTNGSSQDPPGEPAKLWLQMSNESIIKTTSHFEVSHLGTNVADGEQVELDNAETKEPAACGSNACLEYFALD